jgi:hypothetical protein
MMQFDVCRYQVECPICKMRIDLPRQSPLGRFPNLENLPIGEWPATFLCPVCEQVSSYFYEEVLDVAQPLYPDQPPLGLLRTEYAPAQEGSGERSVIYIPCSSGAPQTNERERVRQYVVETERGEVLRQDVIPFE